MKKLITIALTLVALTLTICNLSLIKQENNSKLALVESIASADPVCSLSVGDIIPGSHCVVFEVTGFNFFTYTYNTATCDHSCAPDGTNCCFDLLRFGVE